MEKFKSQNDLEEFLNAGENLSGENVDIAVEKNEMLAPEKFEEKYEELRDYFSEQKLLGEGVELEKIEYLSGGSHNNYHLVARKENKRVELVVRVSKEEKSESAREKLDVFGEFQLLKLVEKYDVAPKALNYDLKSFSSPILIEEYLHGSAYNKLEFLDDEKMMAAIDLMRKVGDIDWRPNYGFNKIPILQDRSFYGRDLQNWDKRIKQIGEKSFKNDKLISDLTGKFTSITFEAGKILNKNEKLLALQRKAFIYPDVHGGNMFWLPNEKKSKFVDWQTASVGDPSFMSAVFCLAFEDKVGMAKDEFQEWMIKNYNKDEKIKDFEKIFYLRIMEREVSNMIWSVWNSVMGKKELPFQNIEEYGRIKRAEESINFVKQSL